MNPAATLLFMHIPKTAGTSVSLALARQYDDRSLYHIRSDGQELAPRFSRNHGPESVFRGLEPQQRGQFLCVLGHYHFGLHEAIPGEARYFTLLRDPLERYVSQVAQYNRMATAGELGAGARPVSLEEFSRLKPAQFNNPQTRWVAGTAERATKDLGPQATLARAQENVNAHFCVVGLVERMDDSLELLARLWGWAPLHVGRANASGVRPSYDEFTPALRDEFEACNQLDRALWDEANRRIDEALRQTERPSPSAAFARPWRRWTQKFSRRAA